MIWNCRMLRFTFFFILCILATALAPAATTVEPVPFEKETLDNGLDVIYSPLHQAPAVHVRVLYHVGSRDEKADRQGFAHMFEHMMFRGSTHVAPEQHMKMIGVAGGDSNAFTSYDQTTYVNTIPSNAVQMALYLEADRMASFKVNDNIFQTERKVVAEEWRMRYANQPLGPMFADFSKLAFQKSSYRWTPIGDMDQLRMASSSELQRFFNTYYVPNNACLIIAGDIDIAKTKAWVHQYFGWIPRGSPVPRDIPQEPPQTEEHKLIVYKPNVPLTNVYMGFKTTDYRSDDHYALTVLADILSSGNSGRLDSKFVNGADPSCVSVEAGDYQLEDQSLFMIEAVIQQGKDPDQVEKDLLASTYEVAEKGITQEELDKAVTQERTELIHRRNGGGGGHGSPAASIASELGEEEVFGGDAGRVNQFLPKLEALKPADIQAIARKYLKSQALTIVYYRPDPTGINARRAAATQAAAEAIAKANEAKNAGVVPSTEPIAPRVASFPAGYPTEPPVPSKPIETVFNKGVESNVNGVKVITLTDTRLPLVDISLIMPGGSDSEPSDKVGLGGMVAQMMERGSAGISFLEFADDLESRGISISAADASDTTRLLISCTTDQLDHAIQRANQMLTQPTFSKDEFDKFKTQWIAGLMQSLSDPSNVADRELLSHLYPGSTLGRITTHKTLDAVTLDDIKKWYQQFYQLDGALVVVSGDVKPEQSKDIVEKLLKGLDRKVTPSVANYTLPAKPSKRQIILVDNPEGKQATIRFSIQSYDIHSDDKFPGSATSQILSAGIESRLNRYVRAEKGLTYGCYAVFRPKRHQGEFDASVDTNPDTAAAAIEAMIKVFNDMKAENVTPTELSEAKSRVAGSMAMEAQTIAQQASMRFEGILNNYPIDYYDKYPQRLAEVSADQVRDVMNKYVKDDQMVFVVVAPASVVKEQLDKLGDVQVLPMPLKREQ